MPAGVRRPNSPMPVTVATRPYHDQKQSCGGALEVEWLHRWMDSLLCCGLPDDLGRGGAGGSLPTRPRHYGPAARERVSRCPGNAANRRVAPESKGLGPGVEEDPNQRRALPG